MDKLPIENNPQLLVEYGRAFVWLNRVEDVLGFLIIMEGKLFQINKKLINFFVVNKTLGDKINIACDFLSKDLIEALKKLNKKRNGIIHGSFNFNLKLQDYKNFEIIHKDTSFNINKKYIEDIIKEAKEVNSAIEKLLENILKKTAEEIKIEREIIHNAKKKSQDEIKELELKINDLKKNIKKMKSV